MLAQQDISSTMSNDRDEKVDPIAAIIDKNLRLVYADLAKETLPDRFKDLLAVLKAQESGPARDAGETET